MVVVLMETVLGVVIVVVLVTVGIFRKEEQKEVTRASPLTSVITFVTILQTIGGNVRSWRSFATGLASLRSARKANSTKIGVTKRIMKCLFLQLQ